MRVNKLTTTNNKNRLKMALSIDLFINLCMIFFRVFFCFCVLPFSLNAQWNLQTTFSTITPAGGATLDYACFCSADTGAYGVSKYLSPSSGIYYANYSTNNAGLNWTTIASGNVPNGGSFFLGCMNAKNKNVIYRMNYYFSGSIWVGFSNTGGVTWGGGATLKNFTAFCGLDMNYFFYLNGKALRKYSSFVDLYYPFTIDSFVDLSPKTLFFTDTLHGFIICSDSVSANAYKIIKTSTGGNNWTTSFADSSKYFYCIVFTSATSGYVAGKNGIVFKTTDGGINWQDVSTGLNKNIYKIDFFNEMVGIVAGDSGFAMTTVNGGQTWNLENTGFSSNINRVYCFNDSIIYAQTNQNVYKRVINVVGINENMHVDNNMRICPNPFSQETRLTFDSYLQNVKIIIKNCLGITCTEITDVSGTSFLLQRNGLRSGIYSVECSHNSKIICQNKFIIID
jgi:hypothetical protein